MSDDKVSLDFLGEQMLRMQADLRGVRSDQVRLETELRADLRALDGKIDSVDAKVERLDAKVERLDAKVDAHDASNQARFAQIQQTAATNLAVTLEAFKGLDRKIEDLR